MTRASDERRLALVEQRAARLPRREVPPELAAWLASLTTEQLTAVERTTALMLWRSMNNAAEHHTEGATLPPRKPAYNEP